MDRTISSEQINEFSKLFRLNLINSITGYKPGNLIGTQDASGRKNLAIFSSIVHLGSNPPLIGMISRPAVVDRNTLSNIKETGLYTINHVNTNIYVQAHQTSAKYDHGVSEFEKTGLTPEYLNDFQAPFVKESNIRIGMKLEETIPIQLNGTILIIGKVQFITCADNLICENGSVDLNLADSVAISGLDTYHSVEKVDQLPYARP